MSEYTPTTDEAFNATIYTWVDWKGTFASEEEAADAWTRMLAEVGRAAAQKAWDAAWTEVSMIPHWWNTEEQRGGFDIQPTGTGAALEEGAFMEVRRVLRDNPYRRNEGKSE